MTQNQKQLQPGQQAAADTPQPPPMLTPDQAVEQLQALIAQVPPRGADGAGADHLSAGPCPCPTRCLQASIGVIECLVHDRRRDRQPR